MNADSSPKTHLWSKEQPGSSYIHRLTACGMWDTSERPLIGTTVYGLVDCKRCHERGRPK